MSPDSKIQTISLLNEQKVDTLAYRISFLFSFGYRSVSFCERVPPTNKKVIIQAHSPKNSIKSVWFETSLMNERLGSANKYCNSVIYEAKVTRAILPVYFNQADACITSKYSFETICLSF